MTFTDMRTLSDILMKASPNNWFSIKGVVDNEDQFNAQVIYENPSARPSWQQALDGRNEEQWVVVRSERKYRLESCDWTVLPDVPMDASKRVEWETYRQELRNITSQPDPFNITWPTPPA